MNGAQMWDAVRAFGDALALESARLQTAIEDVERLGRELAVADPDRQGFAALVARWVLARTVVEAFEWRVQHGRAQLAGARAELERSGLGNLTDTTRAQGWGPW